MQKIEILSAEVFTKSGTSTKTGKPYQLREQAAALHDSANKYPQACRVNLGRDQAPYAPGLYELGSPLSVGGWERLETNRDLGLVLVKQAARAA